MSHDQSLDLCRRASLGMAWTVEIACQMGDVAEAAKYMAACGVPVSVAHRVLLRPHLRRMVK